MLWKAITNATGIFAEVFGMKQKFPCYLKVVEKYYWSVEYAWKNMLFACHKIYPNYNIKKTILSKTRLHLIILVPLTTILLITWDILISQTWFWYISFRNLVFQCPVVIKQYRYSIIGSRKNILTLNNHKYVFAKYQYHRNDHVKYKYSL